MLSKQPQIQNSTPNWSPQTGWNGKGSGIDWKTKLLRHTTPWPGCDLFFSKCLQNVLWAKYAHVSINLWMIMCLLCIYIFTTSYFAASNWQLGNEICVYVANLASCFHWGLQHKKVVWRVTNGHHKSIKKKCIPLIRKSRPDKCIIMSSVHPATVYQNTANKAKYINTNGTMNRKYN